MKTRFYTLLIACLSMLMFSPAEAKPKKQYDTVCLRVEIHCQGCIDKIQKNIAFEKGVKDLLIDKNTQTVTVVYDPAKTNIETLQAAFKKIGKPAEVTECNP